MKRFILAVSIMAMMVCGSAALATVKAAGGSVERALVSFNETVRLRGVFLRGQYLVVHDDERMARGEPCLYIYSVSGNRLGNLEVAFHCQPIKRDRASHFRVVASRRNWFDVPEVLEIQFPGTDRAHQVP